MAQTKAPETKAVQPAEIEVKDPNRPWGEGGGLGPGGWNKDADKVAVEATEGDGA
jgi:hypothetical protein